MRTVVGLYNKFEHAQQAIQALVDGGFDRNRINLIAADEKGELKRQIGTSEGGKQDLGNGTAIGATIGGIGGLLVGLGALAIPGIGPVLAAGPIAAALAGAGIGAAGGALVGALVDLGIPEDQSKAYAEGVRGGGTLVTVQADDQRAQEAVNIMNRFNPVDITQRGRQSMSGEMDTERQRSKTEAIPATGMDIPVIEEDLEVGKREVDKGGVRINTRETQTPVEKDVNLRKEHVDVERRPVDRPASDEDLNAFKEGTYEVTESEEIPMVNKTSRVVEEVHVDKDVTEETETIRDNVRRTDVDVERFGKNVKDSDITGFQEHFRNMYGNTGRNYSDYEAAYRFGHELRRDDRYQNMDWNQVEKRARQDWEASGHPGRWEDVREAIHYAFTGGRH